MSGHVAPPVLLERLAAGRPERVRHVEQVDARDATCVPWPTWLPDDVRAAFVTAGVAEPWRHQAQVAEHARAGQHVVVSTGTASGKSLAYLLPALTSVAEGAAAPDGRGATVLYLAPTKALARDQLRAMQALGLPWLRATAVDGDTPHEERDWARRHANVIVTNPDFVHHALLGNHRGWAAFLRRLTVIVIDECHIYRGVFGSHASAVFRRLRRIAAHLGADPVVVAASATVAEPEVCVSRLIGDDVVAVTDDASPRAGRTIVFWEPGATGATDLDGVPIRRSATSEAAELLADLVVEGRRTLAFVRSRRGAEAVAITARDRLDEIDPDLVRLVASYRAGYLPEERRALEQQLRDGAITGMAATSALELGIDITGLDVVLVTGWPGTRASLWQQIGRAGRGADAALAIFIARDDPLDTYIVGHPDSVLGQPVEASVFDPENPYVLAPHLCAAASELPLTEEAAVRWFGASAPARLDELTAQGLLRRRPTGWFWTQRDRASDLADLRGSGGAPVQIVEEGTGRILGSLDHAAAPANLHPGAVYTHQGVTHLVTALDLEQCVATVVQDDTDIVTDAQSISDVEIIDERHRVAWGDGVLSFGEVLVTEQVVGFSRRRVRSGEFLGSQALDLPARQLRTTAVWWTVSARQLAEAELAEADVAGAAHAAEHASIGLLPLFATCDRWDIGGLSTPLHPDTGLATVFVYDGYPGGAGFAEHGFHTAHAWLTATRQRIAECACANGCPSCVQSPKCGNGNEPLDKSGAVRLLDVLLPGAGAALQH